MYARLHRADLTCGDRCDLLVREAFDVTQQQRRALVSGERRERLLDNAERLAVTREISELGSRGHRFGPDDILVAHRRLEGNLSVPAARAKLVERAVGHDAKDPCPERRALERRQRPPRRQERVLDDILGVGRLPEHAQRVAMEGTLERAGQILERPSVATSRPIEERVARFLWRIKHSDVRSELASSVKSGALEEVRKRVVVIGEDDEPIAALLRDAINDETAYQAVVVADGALVLGTVRQIHADLLILDIMMPGLNGFEVYDRVRADPEIRDMPVLFVSAAAGQFESEFQERGIADVITKPFDLNDLLERVRVLCPADAGSRS